MIPSRMRLQLQRRRVRRGSRRRRRRRWRAKRCPVAKARRETDCVYTEREGRLDRRVPSGDERIEVEGRGRAEADEKDVRRFYPGSACAQDTPARIRGVAPSGTVHRSPPREVDRRRRRSLAASSPSGRTTPMTTRSTA